MLFVLAAALFWSAWLLMPGVGVTDPARIFELVSAQRGLVLASVAVQLVSATLYVPALMDLVRDASLGRRPLVRWGSGLLLAGAMGSAADAVLHLLAYAMTAPGVDRAALTGGMLTASRIRRVSHCDTPPSRSSWRWTRSSINTWEPHVEGIMRHTRFSSRAMRATVGIGLLGLVILAGPFERMAGAAAPQAAPADPGWPRVYTSPEGCRLQIFQPQIASWEGQTHLVAYVAVSHLATGAERPVLGTMKVEAETTVALEQRLVKFASLRIAETSFGSLAREEVKEIVREIEAAMPAFERIIALDHVLAGLDASKIVPKNVEGVKADPPTIFFSNTPAVLVSLDGDPIWSPIAGNDLRFAVNTNWDLFEHRPTSTFYLRHENVWLKASALTGPWTAAGVLPDSFGTLPADANWKDVKASLPGRKIAARDVPSVFVSTTPAELILLRGTPSYVLVAGESDLLWVNNTDSDLFRLGKTGTVYYLVAGRWFSAPGFNGPWTFATPSLPAEFRRISVEHPRSRVLASVPGTSQAAEAVVLAQIPQTARVSKNALEAPGVAYQGEPQFVAIEKTSAQRAVNTDKDVIKVGSLYYLCFQGVWFASSRPQGPWMVAGAVPKEIYLIPVSSPSHRVTYVTIVEDSDDWVVFAAGAGYTGVTVAWGCAVWGTGWYYPPYVVYAGAYPVYYPYYPTYGYAAYYNPWAGTYARGAMAWGPYGAEGVAQAYNPRTGVYAQTRQGGGVYGNWGSTYVQRGDDWAQTSRATNNVTGVTGRVTRTDDGAMVSRTGPNGGGFVAAGEEGVYAGRDGNVYRRGEDGGWQKYENGEWGAAQAPAEGARRERAGNGSADGSTMGQLERDRSARLEGSQRTREQGSVRNGGGNAGSYRPNGGRRAGGGGARAGGGPRGGGRRR